MVSILRQFFKNRVRISFQKLLLGKYTTPELDPDSDLAVKIPDRGLGKKVRIPDPDPNTAAYMCK
jgi:hypothetical protein